MSVNNLSIEQAYQLVADLHDQATGQVAITPTDLSSFISVAQSTLAAGYEPVLNAISQMVSKTIMAVRPYSRKFAGLEVTAEKWGGIIRKISFADREPVPSAQYALADGYSVDQYNVRKAHVLETHYVGSNAWDEAYTVYQDQLNTAFTSPTALGEFMTALTMHFSNEHEQHVEEFARGALCNFIAGKNYIDGSETGSVIHLLTEYNTATGLSLTATTVKQPANFPGFVRWMYARINQISRKMTERSGLFQKIITNVPINRHTPVRDQRVYILADFLSEMEAEVKSITYNDSFLALADNEAVGYWQSIDSPDEIQVTPVVIDSSAVVATGSAQTMTDVIGVIFDRDAIALNIKQENIEMTPYNAYGRYWNMYRHNDIQYQNDFTEKAVVFVLD